MWSIKILILLTNLIIGVLLLENYEETNFIDLGDDDFCPNGSGSQEESCGFDLLQGFNFGMKSVFFRLYNGEKKDVEAYKDAFIKDKNSLSMFTKEFGYNSSQKSIFFIHGFIDSANRHLSKTLASAFLSRGTYNVFDIDWSSMNSPPYFLAIQNLKLVGYAVAHFFELAIEKKLINASDIFLIGHSLGAHLAGYIGRNMIEKLPVIVGLDPAGPEFYTNLTARKLSYNDAKIVHYIETNRFVFGTNYDLGHANYKFNSEAIHQPGCYYPGCSHFRAVEYYAEAVSHPGNFIAVNCESYDHFIESNNCNSTSIIGFPVDISAKGLYYITTNEEKPFGRGEEGIKLSH
uniref:Lipase domain-containing protein n=2 Tax=Clastoptera arizonana TaxID=38151 RepID=A0A1B6D5Q3_9HEMI